MCFLFISWKGEVLVYVKNNRHISCCGQPFSMDITDFYRLYAVTMDTIHNYTKAKTVSWSVNGNIISIVIYTVALPVHFFL